MIVFGQSGFPWEKVVLFGQIGCIRAKVVVFGQSGCIREKVGAKVVVLRQRMLYSGKVVLFGKMVEFGQKWIYLDKGVVSGQN